MPRLPPHFGDFMIGLPAAVENTRAALAAGVTAIGNLGQYFTFRLPYWDDDRATTEATIVALGLIAAQPAGARPFNLDDGFAGLFADVELGAQHGADREVRGGRADRRARVTLLWPPLLPAARPARFPPSSGGTERQHGHDDLRQYGQLPLPISGELREPGELSPGGRVGVAATPSTGHAINPGAGD